jgi:hypothetical protein
MGGMPSSAQPLILMAMGRVPAICAPPLKRGWPGLRPAMTVRQAALPHRRQKSRETDARPLVSWPGLSRPSTTCGADGTKVIDGRTRSGHSTMESAALPMGRPPSPGLLYRAWGCTQSFRHASRDNDLTVVERDGTGHLGAGSGDPAFLQIHSNGSEVAPAFRDNDKETMVEAEKRMINKSVLVYGAGLAALPVLDDEWPFPNSRGGRGIRIGQCHGIGADNHPRGRRIECHRRIVTAGRPGKRRSRRQKTAQHNRHSAPDKHSHPATFFSNSAKPRLMTL